MSARSSSTTSASTARRPTTGAIRTSGCARRSSTARDVAQTMDELGFDVLWTAEHHFQREGYEVFPNLIQLGLWLATQTKRLKFGCALQRAADVAPDPPGRGLRDGRHRHRRPRHHGRRPRLSHPRGRELRRAAARRREANRELFEEQLRAAAQVLQRGRSSITRASSTRCPPPVEYRGYQLDGHHAGAAAEAPAGRDLDADRERQDHRHDGAATASRRW